MTGGPTTSPAGRAEDEPPTGPREHWTRIHQGDSSRWQRHTWPLADAGADLFQSVLEDQEHAEPFTLNGSARIVNADGDPLMYLVGADEYSRLQAARQQMDELRDQHDDWAVHPAYQGPGTGGDGLLLDLDPIREILGEEIDHYLRGHDPDAEPEDTARRRAGHLTSGAVRVALATTLPGDIHGTVPVRCLTRTDETVEVGRWVWALAYETPARGLFVRGGVNWLGDEYSVVAAGCGYSIRKGFVSRDVATDYAVAIAAAVPAIDWRVWQNPPDATTPDLLAALRAENARWRPWGRDPDPTPDTTGPDAGTEPTP